MNKIVAFFLDKKEQTCDRCYGRGHNSRGDSCWQCEGTGKIYV